MVIINEFNNPSASTLLVSRFIKPPFTGLGREKALMLENSGGRWERPPFFRGTEVLRGGLEALAAVSSGVEKSILLRPSVLRKDDCDKRFKASYGGIAEGIFASTQRRDGIRDRPAGRRN